MVEKAPSAPRVAALVGPYLSGKTSLLESLLFVSGTISRKGSVTEGNSVGDSSPEARGRQMSVEPNIAGGTYLGESWTFIDCPGSFEFLQDTCNALMVADVAVVVTAPDPGRAIMVAPILKFLDDRRIPHILFINRIDQPDVDIRATLEALQGVSERPLVLRALPIREGEDIVGYVDLVSERAFKYGPDRPADQPAELVRLPDSFLLLEADARREMLEHLADFDDQLLEKLLEDVAPPVQEIFQDLSREVAADLVVPVLFGSAVRNQGLHRLLKALRHDTPESAVAAARLGVAGGGDTPHGHVFKTTHVPHLGKLSLVRIWSGVFSDGMTANGERVGGVLRLMGGTQTKVPQAGVGEVVALGRLESVATGHRIAPEGGPDPAWPRPLAPLMALALEAVRKGDEVKVSGALHRLIEEDPSLKYEFDADLRQLLLWGQGDVHLQVAVDRLKSLYNVEAKGQRPDVPYKETIRRGVNQHGRHKRQTGGHGQFGDVHITIEPLPRGGGFVFADSIVGGVVPKQYISAVEEGVEDYLQRGPLGFPILDLKVILTDGSYHTVDSSDMAFKTAAQIAMREGMPKCEPVLLEPIIAVELSIPAEHTSRAQRLLSQRRGQILGFDCKEGWKGWDVVSAHMPQAEMHDLIIELRSMTMGVGTFSWRFDHLQELVGKPAETVVRARAEMI
ncbi:MAG: elongation factor G [Rhodospirillaceae bacterium]|nr:MAG: elongation factor G [Rhodospirillaceae bacterium]